MPRRPLLLRLGALATYLLVVGAIDLAAHVGGHEATPGTSLHVWTAPRTGEWVPGSLLFVSGETAHVEDLRGRVYTWRVVELAAPDRQVVDRFLDRTALVNHPRSPVSYDGPPLTLWLAVVACLGGLLLVRAGLVAPAMARIGAVTLPVVILLACDGSSGGSGNPSAPSALAPPAGPAGTLASYFSAFPQHVRTREDGQNLYVESDGLADHTMMTGIRSWQQQVPLPADYTGGNAWTIPLAPRLADQPVSARTGLFRGAIALAVNGVPIFNALNNRGEDALLAGELDEFGGHAGRADDYHYHTAPLFLSSTVGATRPIAVALDGFPLYGSVEPDGTSMRALDDYNGHPDGDGGYHYHGTRSYPYINGGMKGVVRVTDQVEPQPALRPVRPAGAPLTGATITRYISTGVSSWTLEYQIAGRTYRVDYRIQGSQAIFVFTDPSGVTRTEVYSR
jgi:hypothetical protein